MSGTLDYLSSPFVVRAIIGVFLIAINAAISGGFAVFRHSTFLISGAAHAALAGAALVIVLESRGFIQNISPIVGAAIFAVALALLAAWAANRGPDKTVDTAIGVGFAFSMALAVLLISLVPEAATRVWGILLGDLLLLTPADLWLIGGMTLILVVVVGVFRRQFLFVTFDTEGAKAFGVRAELYNYLLFALIGLSCAIILKGVGAIVVFAMLAAPAATALLVASSVPRAMFIAFAIAAGSGLVAILVSFFVDVSASALTALLAAGSYFLVLGYQRLRPEGAVKPQ